MPTHPPITVVVGRQDLAKCPPILPLSLTQENLDFYPYHPGASSTGYALPTQESQEAASFNACYDRTWP
jgi:hypothetical protein